MIPSISYNQHDILRWINELHLDGKWIECDPCYSSGQFYRPDDIPKPKRRYDINAPSLDVIGGDCRELPFEDRKLLSLIFDPPFLQTTGKGSIIKDRFGSYPTMDSLWDFYYDSLLEFYRILKPDGILIVKMQNTVMSGKQYWSVDYIKGEAVTLGFKMIDEFILLAKNRMERTGKYTQRHARKFHCYFLVFRKLQDS